MVAAVNRRTPLRANGVVGMTHRYRDPRIGTRREPVLLHDWINDRHVKNGIQYPFYDLVNFNRDSQILAWVKSPAGTPVLKLLSIDQAVRHAIDPATGQGLGYRALAGFTNSLLDNRDLSAGNWTTSTGVASKNAVGLDGISNSAHTLEDDNASNLELARQSVTVSDDGNAHTASIYVKKDEDESRFPDFDLRLLGGTTTLAQSTSFNTKTGAKSERNSDGTTEVQDHGDWWRVVSTLTNNSSGNTELRLTLYPALGTTIGVVDNSATGSIVYDFGGVYLNSSIAGPPIETEGSTVSTAADDASEPLPASCQDGFVWVVHARTGALDPDNDQFLGNIRDSADGASSSANRIFFDRRFSGVARLFVEVEGVTASTEGDSIADDTDIKVAIRAADGDYAFCVNGGTVHTVSQSGFPSGLDEKNIGNARSGTEVHWNGTIALDYLDPDPSAWTDADLQAATS